MELSQLLWIFGALLLFAWYLSNVAGRLDRLHLKAEAAKLSLDTQLALRTSSVGRLIEKLNNQNYEIKELPEVWQEAIKREAEDITDDLQWQYESSLTVAINNLVTNQPELLTHPEFEAIISDIAQASRRVQYAKAFHNDAQKNALKVRQRPLVKIFRLAGRAKLPALIEFDDFIAPALKNK